MDWANERYVRLYVRDTVTWNRLGWDGQCVLMHLLRKVDRSGTLDLSGLEAWEGVMLAIRSTEDVARRGVEVLLRTGTAVVVDGRLAFPSFIEAQECSKSDAQRQRESRDRRAAPGKAFNATRDGSTLRPNTSTPAVTIRDDMPSQVVTDSSQSVTTSHDRSQKVTFGHSVLCSAVHSSADPPKAPQGAAPAESSVGRSKSKLDSMLAAAGEAQRAAEESAGDWTPSAQRVAFVRAFEASQRTTPSMGGRTVGSFHADVVRTAELQGRDPGELFAEVVTAWLARGLSEVERRAPYACFHSAWGDLTAKGAPRPPSSPQPPSRGTQEPPPAPPVTRIFSDPIPGGGKPSPCPPEVAAELRKHTGGGA